MKYDTGGKAFSKNTGRGEDDVGARLEGSLLNTSGDNTTDTFDLVDTRDGHSEWFLGWSLWDVVQNVENSLSGKFLLLWLDGESAVTRHFVDSSIKFSPLNPDIRTKVIFFVFNLNKMICVVSTSWVG